MMDKEETTRLNRVGAEVCKDSQKLTQTIGGDWGFSEGEYALDLFNPVHDPRHTEMVLDEMCKKGWHILTETTTDKVTLKKRGGLRFTAKTSLPDKGRRIMEAVDKAIESEKGE